MGHEFPNPRAYLIRRLRQELLGPKGGKDETLLGNTDPREEYTTGVLDVGTDLLENSTDPADSGVLEGSEAVSSLDTGYEEDESPDPLLVVADFAPSVDPRRLPCSIGLSFFVQTEKDDFLSVCLSGGRYRSRLLEGEKCWVRTPKVWLVPKVSLSSRELDLKDSDSGMRLVVRTRPLPGGRVRVSLYLLNLGQWPGQSKERASRFLYQPQIRVRFGDGVSLLSLSESGALSDDEEEQKLQLLYLRRPVKARGHLCSAVWQDIDPEQEPENLISWDDGTSEAEEFRRCDVRTELLPMLAVPVPDPGWRAEFGPSPVREAKLLSELPQSEMATALGPLVEGYRRWLLAQENEVSNLPEQFRTTAREQIRYGRESMARVRAGINLVATDPNAYLAFCFANRAVHDQASWERENALVWRPFQLAFLLLCLPGLSDPASTERDICDLLWFPTGGGKTEAYLGLTAFTLGMRRLRHSGYDGVGVLSRYTLRLLTIQQFRRALKLITACEMLRVTPTGSNMGWRPDCSRESQDWLWGHHRFSAGLWVGSAVTPNQLHSTGRGGVTGAFEALREGKGQGEPAQVTECPVCGSHLVIDDETPRDVGGVVTFFLRVQGVEHSPTPAELSTQYLEVLDYTKLHLSSTLQSLKFRVRALTASLDLDSWWGLVRKRLGDSCQELCARATRPGYFIEQALRKSGKVVDQRIELFCPDPDCLTAKYRWQERLPMTLDGQVGGFQTVPKAVAIDGAPDVARQCPIPAVTVDDQIYSWPPSLLVTTVDKWARLAFEPRAASLFGNVEYYHASAGFYRAGCLASSAGSKFDSAHPIPVAKKIEVDHFPTPDLVIQDELHLIDGPLGSMVGLYETVVSALCGEACKVKYVASTATVREAKDQVQSLFSRNLRQFPPPSLDSHDSFFALMRPGKVSQAKGPGRLYLGHSAPGRGSLTPQVRLWSVLLQAAQELRDQGVPDEELDPYWTPVGYFTAIKSLAAAGGLWRQNIPMRVEYLGGDGKRELGAPVELSSRVHSHRLPGLLNRLGQSLPDAVDGVLSTSMFGTGVDVSRLSLMVVQGQPKTTSSYIQATGRVGRQSPGLVVVNLPASNPRALDHFEFFTGYHHQLYRGVEAVTVFPFAPRARERALGALCVALLRQMKSVSLAWRNRRSGASLMSSQWDSPEVQALFEIFESRAQEQPDLRRPESQRLAQEVEWALEAWRELAERESSLQFEEYTLRQAPKNPVVLGSPQHEKAGLPVVFPNAPQSLREVEATTGFQI